MTKAAWAGLPPEARGGLGSGVAVMRDVQREVAHITLRDLATHAAQAYMAAARVVGRSDAVVDCLQAEMVFDLRTVWVAHEYMADFWCNMPGRTLRQTCWSGEAARWMAWAAEEPWRWMRQEPGLLRAFCLVLVQQNNSKGILAEMDLWDALCRAYPMPGRQPLPPLDRPRKPGHMAP